MSVLASDLILLDMTILRRRPARGGTTCGESGAVNSCFNCETLAVLTGLVFERLAGFALYRAGVCP